ncbi:magnesium transporter [Mycolicibacterium duvalii]|uniref:Magnesium transporter n=1 Tax=Mycolicibacterium duvalii TaxID=39688 RepID=A0A7I7K377_9MYCO|nr:magnesium transporter CorA family protein [Mycolicibacterium duvalii]MCV7367790.1 magnesium transporter CorA family protein [Mycolicibacterium duvalii]PEG42479.1 magnesium transporter [Mycolicibacterium duvalii]BBX18620.1 magnesium transporter [Mycolicibacterium duvalii]
MTHIRGRIWVDGQPRDGFDFFALSEYLATENTLAWCDIDAPDHATLRDLAHEIGLNEWAVEDTLAEAERTKAMVYKTHTFFTVYGVTVSQAPLTAEFSESLLTMHRISVFVLPRGVITVRLGSGYDIEQVSRRFDELGGQKYGAGALVHGLLDVVVDGHFDAVQALDDAIESLEDDLFAERAPRKGVQRKTFQLRKDLVALRRAVLPMREVVTVIQHRRMDATSTAVELDPVYADLYDHVLRVSEWTESLRDMITTVFETNLSLQDARLNIVMKKLTGWAAIIAVPTAITGYYGQNLAYPGVNTVGGFVVSSALIVVLVVVLYLTFKKRDWL